MSFCRQEWMELETWSPWTEWQSLHLNNQPSILWRWCGISCCWHPPALYNVYSGPLCESLDINQIWARVTQDRVIMGGRPMHTSACWIPCKRPNAVGFQIAYVLETFPKIVLLNAQEPMHVRGGVLALNFTTATMVERIQCRRNRYKW